MKSKYLFSGEQKITASCVVDDFIWLFFLGVSNIIIANQASVFNPNIKYWEIEITGDEVTSVIEDTFIYLSLKDTVNIGAKISGTTPIVSYYIKNVGIVEDAIDLITNTTYTYFLTPGIASGINSKIVKYNKSTRAFVEIIDLTTLFNATKIDIDITGVIWVQSDLDGTPKVTKVWNDGSWHFTTYTLS